MLRKGISLGMVGGAALVCMAAPARADWPVVFNNYCTVGAYRVCASSNINLSPDGRTLTIDFWNNERVNDRNDINGQSSTITAIALYHNPSLTLALTAPPTYTAQYFDASGTSRNVTDYWSADPNDIGNIANVRLDSYTYPGDRKNKLESELIGGATGGNQGGIVGCNDPGGPEHFSTCIDSAMRPYMRFTFAFQEAIGQQFVSNGLNMRFHAQQLGADGKGSVKCDTGVQEGEHACVPTNTVPEPMSMTLLATGLVGLGAAARRRRRSADGAAV